MKISQQIKNEQKQILGAAQLQSLELLAMDTAQMEAFLQNEYLDNPLMDYTAEHSADPSIEHLADWTSPVCPGPDIPEESGEDLDLQRNLTAVDTQEVKRHVLGQLDLRNFSSGDLELIRYLTDCLDHNGFLALTEDELGALTGCPSDQISRSLAILRDLEPAGIFASDLPHCLLKQLEAEGNTDSCLQEIILHYLPALGEGKISVISRNLGISTGDVRKYMAQIARLNPRPLSCVQEGQADYILPDILFTCSSGHWEITINDHWTDRYHINDYYVQMMKTARDPELLSYFRGKLERSRMILSGIEQRHKTLTEISQAILDRQLAYFEGKEALAPMTVSDLAASIEVHPSTVSRAIKGKYLQSPRGTIPLRQLFSAAVSAAADQEGLSARSIQQRIRALVDAEDKKRPYSDARLQELLKEQGISISRRAVTKYREALMIKSSFDRKLR